MEKIIFLSKGLKSEFYDYIESKNYKIIKVKKSNKTYDSISNHPDIFIFSTGKKIIVAPCIYEYLKEKLNEEVHIIKGEEKIKMKYPNNIYYNVARVGEFCIHNLKHTSKKIKEEIDVKWINVNQGYSKCNTLIVDDKSIITSDKGIYKEVIKNDLNGLLIESGNIKLRGLDYGFIGGASIRLDNEIVFYGNIMNHPDFFKIEKFIKDRGLKIKYFKFDLEDIGSGIKVIKE